MMRLVWLEAKKLAFTPVLLVLLAVIVCAAVVPLAHEVRTFITVNETYSGKPFADFVPAITAELEAANRFLPLTRKVSPEEMEWEASGGDPTYFYNLGYENYTELNFTYPYSRSIYEYDLKLYGREDTLPEGYVFGEDIPDDEYPYYVSISLCVQDVESAGCYRQNGTYLQDRGRHMVKELEEEREETFSYRTIEQRLESADSEVQSEKLLLQREMLDTVGMPIVCYAGTFQYWEQIEGYAPLVIAVLLAFVLAPVFSHEFETNMYLLLSASRGGKRRLFWCKLAGAWLLSVSVILLYNAACAGICIGLGTAAGAEVPLGSFRSGGLLSYVYTPYDITVGELFAYRIGYQLLGATALTALVSFVSVTARSAAVAVCVGEAALLAGALAREMRYGVDGVISDFSLTNAFAAGEIFDRFEAYRIFGWLVPYPVLYAGFLLIGAAALVLLARIVYTGRKCNEVK